MPSDFYMDDTGSESSDAEIERAEWRISMQDVYLKKQAKWVKANKLRVGDRVKVTRKAEDNEDGWPNSWIEPDMDSAIGAVGIVKEIDRHCDTDVQFNHADGDFTYGFPYFVLEKVQ